MTTPQETPNETPLGDKTDGLPANENPSHLVPLREVEVAFDAIQGKLHVLKTASLFDVTASLVDLERTTADLREQLRRAAVEAGRRVTEGTVEIRSDAPAIIVRRSIGEAISRGDLRPGQKLPGKDIILVTVWDPTNRQGEGLGKKLATFGAPKNLPGEPQTFNRNAASIAKLKNWHGHNGWRFDRQRYGTRSYEDARFKGYQDGSAIGNWGVPELPVLNGQGRNGNLVIPAANILALSQDKQSPFYNSFVTIRSSADAGWSQSCTEDRGDPGYVHTVRFSDGSVHWGHKGNDTSRSCVRPVVALELNHLIL